jgi:hypothetical protein
VNISKSGVCGVISAHSMDSTAWRCRCSTKIEARSRCSIQ